ncbi:unnamed protein product, partial [Discosporangium mesarthrocarpum]
PADLRNPLGVHVEGLEDGQEDSEDEQDKERMKTGEQKILAAEHFSFYALEGGTGRERWRHQGRVASEEVTKPEEQSSPRYLNHQHHRQQQHQHQYQQTRTYKLQELEDLQGSEIDTAHGSWRRYQATILPLHLPHYWSHCSHTRLAEASLRRQAYARPLTKYRAGAG